MSGASDPIAKDVACTAILGAKTAARHAGQIRRAAVWAEWQQRGDHAAGVKLATHGAALLRAADRALNARPRVVSAYHPMRTELDPLPLLQSLAERGFATCLPVVGGRDSPLLFRAWSPGAPTVAAGFGTRQPPPDAAVAVPQLLLVPLLAFDRRGFRLGYGGGYYDRTLQALRALPGVGQEGAVLAIGVAFDEQEVDAVPHLDYDQRLDGIVTPSGLRSFPA